MGAGAGLGGGRQGLVLHIEIKITKGYYCYIKYVQYNNILILKYKIEDNILLFAVLSLSTNKV